MRRIVASRKNSGTISLSRKVLAAAIRALDPAESVVRVAAGGEIDYPGPALGRIVQSDSDEEYARAYIVAHLARVLGYKPDRLRLDEQVPVRVGRKRQQRHEDKWGDLTLRDDRGRVFLLMEVKAPGKWRSERSDALEGQLFGLADFIKPRPRWLAYATVTTVGDKPKILCDIIDGAGHRSFGGWEESGGRLAGHELPRGYVPPAKRDYVRGGDNDLTAEVSDDELADIRRGLHNVLWGGGGTADADVFNFLVRLLLAKIQDELATPKGERYQVQDNGAPDRVVDQAEARYQSALQSRIGYTAEQARKQRLIVGGGGISTDKFIYAVNRLQRLHLTRIAENPGARDILGDFFERIMRDGFKQSKGQFFTHPIIIRFLIYALRLDSIAVDMVNSATPRLPVIIDPAAGSGAFLVEAMKAVARAARTGAIKDTVQARAFVREKFHRPRKFSWAEDHCFGLELNSHLGLAAQVNMVLHSDGSSAMLVGDRGDGLSPFAKYPRKFLLAEAKSISGYDKPVNENFDAVLSNPPFSVTFSGRPESKAGRRKVFELADYPSQAMFLERWFQLLKPGGRLGVVLPNSVFDGRNAAARRIREFLLRHFSVKAVIALPADAFYPYTSTKTSLLLARKKTLAERAKSARKNSEELLADNGAICFAEIKNPGFSRTTRKDALSSANDFYRADKSGDVVDPDAADNGLLGKLRQAIQWDGACPPIDLSGIGGSNAGRMDAGCNLWVAAIPKSRRAPLTDYFDISAPPILADGNIPRRLNYCEIGDVSPNESVDPERVNLDASDGEGNERLAKKIRGGDIMKPQLGDILVARVRVYLGKILTVRRDDLFFSRAFVVMRPKDEARARLYYLLLRDPLLPLLVAYSRWGVAYPTLDADDLRAAVVDRRVAESFLNNPTNKKRADDLTNLFATLADTQEKIAGILRPPA